MITKSHASKSVSIPNSELSDESELEKKAQAFKAGLDSSEDSKLSANSLLLFKILKHLCSYHERKLSDVVTALDDAHPLDISRLRLKLCSHTVVSRLQSEDF
jgi:hypothetical protein